MHVRHPANLILALALFAAAAPARSESPGRFNFVGPTGAEAEVLAIKWRYSFMFSVDTKTLRQVRFTCDGIPGTTVIVQGPDLVLDARGYAFAESAPIPVGETTTPWLLDPEVTLATCAAIVTDLKGKQSRENAPVSFTAQTKLAMLLQLEEMFKYNRQQKARPATAVPATKPAQ